MVILTLPHKNVINKNITLKIKTKFICDVNKVTAKMSKKKGSIIINVVEKLNSS
jgi:hypothetical protein